MKPISNKYKKTYIWLKSIFIVVLLHKKKGINEKFFKFHQLRMFDFRIFFFLSCLYTRLLYQYNNINHFGL